MDFFLRQNADAAKGTDGASFTQVHDVVRDRDHSVFVVVHKVVIHVVPGGDDCLETPRACQVPGRNFQYQ